MIRLKVGLILLLMLEENCGTFYVLMRFVTVAEIDPFYMD